MKIFNVILIIFIVLISISTVNAVELNVTDGDVLSLDVSPDNSTELLSEDEKISTSIKNNTNSDFNNSEYTINRNDLSSNLKLIYTHNINDNGLILSNFINDMWGNINSNGISTSSGTINLVKTNMYTPIYNNNINSNPIIKDKYDLRNDGYVSSIKNQFGNSCWAHAALSALESCILKATGIEYDFSEIKLSNLADEYLGTSGNRNGRGNIYMSMGYINSWLGTVKENSNSDDSIINVQNIYIIFPDNFEKGVKEAILKYGGVVASYYSVDKYYNENNYYNYEVNNETNHEITIIGWDDNYNKNNFKNSPKSNGAWICKNSYGSRFGDKGYFYISYYDKTLGKLNPSYTFILNDSTKYNKNYQYDIQITNVLNDYNSYKNIFTSEGNENLVAISSYFDKYVTYTISINANNKVYTQTFTPNSNGYFTVKLKNAIPLSKGQKFEVIIKNPYNYFYICNESKITKKLPEGVSYVSKDDGRTWIDAVTKHKSVCCIKTFTTTTSNLKNRPTIIAKDLTKYYKGNEKLEVKLNNALNNRIDITLNDVLYHKTVTDGVLSMNIGLPSGKYATIIAYSDSNFDLKVTILITINPTIIGKDITKYYKNGTQYSVTCYDSNGNLLKNSNVQFNINGVMYTRTTNSEGIATLNINLLPEKYIITAKNTKTNENCANKIVVKTILQAHDLTKRYGTSDPFTVTLLNGEGKGYANQNIKININGVIYTRTTDNNGVAHLNINLPPNTYIATATYDELSISQIVNVIP